MGKHRESTTKRRRRFSRADAAILLCGILGFLSLTFGAPLLQAGEPGAGGTAATVESPGTTSFIEWPESAGATQPVARPAAPTQEASGPPDPVAAVAAEPAPAPAGPVLPDASAPVRIQYAAAAIDTAVHPLEPDNSAMASQTIVPPTTMDGYWLMPFGAPGNGSTNTTYIIGHSWEGRDAPFNHLSSDAAVGDEFDVVTGNGTIRYRVDSVTTYVKAALKDSPIWDMVPNRIVLISCYTEDPWGKNVVVSASPAVA
ncbi:class F sortase [Arthrobacter sp. D1-29]